MLTVSPNVVDVITPACNADGVVGVDPECEFVRIAGTFHTCTDRDGRLVASGKSCWSWARHQVVFGSPDEARDFEADAAGPAPDGRCEICTAPGAVDVITRVGAHVLCDGCADVVAEAADVGPDNRIYGSPAGDPSFHFHTRRPGLGFHQHAGGTAPHHHDRADPTTWCSAWSGPSVTVAAVVVAADVEATVAA